MPKKDDDVVFTMPMTAHESISPELLASAAREYAKAGGYVECGPVDERGLNLKNVVGVLRDHVGDGEAEIGFLSNTERGKRLADLVRGGAKLKMSAVFHGDKMVSVGLMDAMPPAVRKKS
jgi:hypothetical protein